MKLLFVGNLPPHRGGSATANASVLIGLERLGHQVHALAPMTKGACVAGDPFATAHPGLRVQRYVVDEFLIDPWNAFPGRARGQEIDEISLSLPRLLDLVAPDVVILGRESFAWIAPAILRSSGIPSLVITHGILNRLAQADSHSDEDRATLDALRAVDVTVLASLHMAEAAHRLGLPEIRDIPNAVDLDRFCPAPKSERLLQALGLSRDDVIALHASNLKSIKRAGDIVAAAADCLPRQRDLHFLFVGEGPGRAALLEQCLAQGIQSRVRFVDWVESTLMPEYINLADMVIMASETENQPMIVLESQACGKPVVASDIPGHRELINNGNNGLIFPVGDHLALATSIVDLARDRNRRCSIASRTRSFISGHDITTVARRYESVLLGLAKCN